MFKKLFPPIHPTIKALIKELDPNSFSGEFVQGGIDSDEIIKKDMIKTTNFRLEYIEVNPGFVTMKLFSQDAKHYIPLNNKEKRALSKAGSKLWSEFYAG